MKYYQVIDRLTEILLAEKLEYKDTIIIGDNSSGKSDVLKQLIGRDKKEQFYFVDAVNRYFNVSQIMPDPVPNVVYSNEINKHRLEEDNFNHKDSFYYQGIPMAIEELYANYTDDLNAMMEEFLDITFNIQQGKIGWEIYVNGDEVILSSGYQALLRIFLEVFYFMKTKGTGTVIIDEIDEFLSVANSGRILEFLRKKFSELNFIVTTHSADLIARSDQINLVLLKEQQFEAIDAGDFSSISQVYDIFEAILGKKDIKTEKQQIDEKLRMLLNNKMAGIWEQDEKDLLQSLKSQKITKAQKLVIKQIEAW
ncbi:MAG: AAA family ATPase [Lachnospira eligens]|nr:AAA family ATPase [Lachnospira eligens]